MRVPGLLQPAPNFVSVTRKSARFVRRRERLIADDLSGSQVQELDQDVHFAFSYDFFFHLDLRFSILFFADSSLFTVDVMVFSDCMISSWS